jgi:hypothetical protein
MTPFLNALDYVVLLSARKPLRSDMLAAAHSRTHGQREWLESYLKSDRSSGRWHKAQYAGRRPRVPTGLII